MKNLLTAILMILVGAGLVFADMKESGEYDKTKAILSAGYNWVETDDVSGRAAEYVYQDASGTASMKVTGGAGDSHFILDAKYLNENDYSFSAHFDRNNAQRLDLRIEQMFHNLDHIDYVNRPDAVAATTATPRAEITDLSPTDEYSLKVGTFETNFRAKLPDMPSHISIGYWQFKKDGEKQMRFVDESCSPCHLYSKTRNIDRTTHQMTGGFDAHLGKFDLIFKQIYREIVIDDPTPVDAYGNHFRLRPGPGNYEHNDDPESELYESTLEVHSSLAGGVNLAVSGTYGKRTNNSTATSADPIIAETEYWKAAADITHTTSPKFSYNFKTRFLDTDATNTYPLLLDPFTSGGTDVVDVRPPMDLQRGVYELNASLRPNSKITYKGSLKIEHIKRSETGPAMPFHSSNSSGVFENDVVWELPDEEIITKAKIGFFSRPAKVTAFKVNGYYQFQHSDDPAYGTSFEDSHMIFLSTTYAINPKWGFNASARATLETNDEHKHDVIFSEGPTVLNTIELDREMEQENINLGAWYNPAQNVTTMLNYGYNRTAIVQDLMFGTDPNFTSVPSATPNYIIVDDDVDFLQEVHTFSGSVGFALRGNMKANLSGYYTRSFGFYEPNFPVANYEYITNAGFADADPAGMKEISHFDIDQYGVKAAIDYYFTPDFELTLEYGYDDYDDKYTNDFDGSVQSATANLAYRF